MPEDVHAVVAGYPNMSLEHGRKIYDMILSHGSRRVLELGFNWGVSSCYIAAALQTQGGDGHLVSIDLQSRASFDPGIEGFLDKLGLRRRVTVFYEATTFNWRLRRFLRMDPRPEFDLVFLDGPHLWEPDALAFLLAEKMLRPGGLFVFDDLNWTLSNSPFHREQEATLALPADERNTAHVREVFELLVKTHPNIEATWENSAWGHARKRKTPLSGGLDAWIAEEAKAVKRHASQHCGPKKGLNAPGKG